MTENLKQQLSRLCEAVPKDPNTRYSSLYEAVLDRGYPMSLIERPQTWELGRVKFCFENCMRRLEEFPDRYIYCEGFVLVLVPLHHAWLLDVKTQAVVEMTLDLRQTYYEDIEYFGIPFDTDQVLDQFHTANVCLSLLNDWERGHPILAGTTSVVEHSQFSAR